MAIPALKNTLNLFGQQIPTYNVMQHLSTLIGGLGIAFALSGLEVNPNITGRLDRKYWSIVTCLTLMIISIRMISGLNYKMYGHLIVTAISAGLISLVLAPLIVAQLPALKLRSKNTTNAAQ